MRLHLQPGGWTLADADATAAPVHAFGATALLGQVGVTVCAPHVPWQAFVPPLPTDPAQPPAGTGQEVQEMPGAQEVQEVHDVQEVQEVQEVRMRSPAAPRPRAAASLQPVPHWRWPCSRAAGCCGGGCPRPPSPNR
ncbi:hypothetical protein ACFQOZ_06290 [Comamonas endophytica]|uniref:hypothetical protein n=1 Tax=Comamonas endophytica TaxID=2949090 RepID=UPI0036224BC7